jgi:hypothetical protein
MRRSSAHLEGRLMHADRMWVHDQIRRDWMRRALKGMGGHAHTGTNSGSGSSDHPCNATAMEGLGRLTGRVLVEGGLLSQLPQSQPLPPPFG